GRWRGASWPSQTRSASCVASSRLLRLALGPRWFARGLTLEEREEPLEVVVEARELAHQRRRGGFVEAMAHLRAVELDVAHAALSSRAASTRFFSERGDRAPLPRLRAVVSRSPAPEPGVHLSVCTGLSCGVCALSGYAMVGSW